MTADNPSDVEAHGLPNRLATLALISALVRGKDDLFAAVGEAKRALHKQPPPNVDARIRFLASRLGLPDIHPARLAEVWSSALRSGRAVGRRELLDLARRAVVSREEPDEEVGRWRRALLSRVEAALSSFNTVDSFTVDTPPEIRETHLELDRLLSHWPRRLLHDREWAFAEAPLPDMEPLPLDGVWVVLARRSSGPGWLNSV